MKLYVDVDKNLVLQGVAGMSGVYSAVKRGYITVKRGSSMGFEVYPVHSDMSPAVVDSKLVFGIKKAGVFDGDYLAGGTASKGVDAEGVVFWALDVVFQSAGIDAALCVDTVEDNDKGSVECGGEFSWMMGGKVSSFSMTFPVVVQNNINRDLDPPPALLPTYPQATEVATRKDIAGLVNASLPVGGTTGQVLAKAGSANYNVGWVDQPPLTTQTLTLPSGKNIVGYEVVGGHPVRVGLDVGGLFQLLGTENGAYLVNGSMGVYGSELSVGALALRESAEKGSPFTQLKMRNNVLYHCAGGSESEVALVKNIKSGIKVIYPSSEICKLWESDVPDAYSRVVIDYGHLSGESLGLDVRDLRLNNSGKWLEIEIIVTNRVGSGSRTGGFSLSYMDGFREYTVSFDFVPNCEKYLLQRSNNKYLGSSGWRWMGVSESICDSLNAKATYMSLSANMGRVLNEKIDAIEKNTLNFVVHGGIGGLSLLAAGIRCVNVYSCGATDLSIAHNGQVESLVEMNIYICSPTNPTMSHKVDVMRADGSLVSRTVAGMAKLSIMVAKNGDGYVYGKLNRVYDNNSV